MNHRGILLAAVTALAAVLALTAPAGAVPSSGATPHAARLSTHVSAPSAPDVAGIVPRATTGSCQMTENGWSMRPTTCVSLPKVTCQGTEFCIHYTSSGQNAATSSWVSATKSSLNNIYSTYQKSGYRMPRADDDADGAPAASKNAVDIYLVDFATFDGGAFAGYYGYCAPTPPVKAKATSAFCVFDNDYANKGFTTGTETPQDVLHVTAAHEFFHAVQFGYDADADPWIMEASSTWAEDQLYTGVNDNRQYVPFGPMGKPGFPMDDYWYEQHGTTLANGRSDPRDFTPYGDWIFLRYLTEHFGQKSGPLPILIRQIWQAMDSTKRTPKSSINAVAAALKKHKTTLVKQWGAFTAANRAPAKYYSEGAAYKVAKPTHATTVSRSHRTRQGTFTLQHLTAATERITGSKVAQGWHLHVHVSVPAARASAATAWFTIWKANGAIAHHAITLRKGAGQASLGFASKTIKRVELTVGNAQTTYRCNTGKMYSCDGTPTGNGMKFSWKATLSR